MNFYSEWITITQHRVLLECSFPDDEHRFIAKVAVETCEHFSYLEKSCDTARIICVFYNDKASCYDIFIASTNPKHEELVDRLTIVFNNIYPENPANVVFELCKEGESSHDKYNRTQYLAETTKYSGVNDLL